MPEEVEGMLYFKCTHSGNQTEQGCFQALLFPFCVILDQALGLSGPQFPICKWGGGLSETMPKRADGPRPRISML